MGKSKYIWFELGASNVGGKVRNIVCNACNAGRYVGGKVSNAGVNVGNAGG